jgi:hypothetical protein
MAKYIDVDVLWRDITSNIEYCGDVLEIIERQQVVTINDLAEEIKVTNCNHNAEVSKMVSSSCGHKNGKDVIYRQDAIDQIQAIESLATLPDNDAVIRMNDIEKILYNLPSAQPDFDITVKIDKAYDRGYEAGYLQAKHDWGDLDE